MGHLPGLIADLALILITAAITTILFKRIRQPLVLGYIIAGVLVGPHLSITPTVTDTENIEIWAEIGVIFLLFSLGLEFSFRKLKNVGGSASITAIVEIIFITLTGYLLGIWMGWSIMDSVFLGGMLASSSTTIISKAFDELGVKTKQYSGVVIGVLIVEDIVVILLMVLISTISVTKQIEGTEVVFTIVKLLFFLILWFIAGIFLIPTFLKKARKLLNDETLLILSIGLCLVMVVLATKVGFSAELGAFIMGSILAETTSAEKIEHLVKPVRDLFGAIFFVSVGMMIDPGTMLEYRWPILWVTLLVLLGKFISTSGGALLSGQPLKQSIQVGMSMAQVGEFAFIVASLGLSLGVTSDFLFPVAVGVSAITAFTTPYMIRYSPDFYDFIAKIFPARWISSLQKYSLGTQDIKAESNWKILINEYRNIVITNSIIVLAIFLLAVQLLQPLLMDYIEDRFTGNLIVMIAALGVAAPFLWALMAKRPGNTAFKELWREKKYNRGPLFLIEIARVIAGLLLTGFLLDRLFSSVIALIITLPVIILLVFFFSRRTQNFYHRLESTFLNNLQARDINGSRNSTTGNTLMESFGSHPDLNPWDAHMVEMEVNQNADYIGRTIEELAWREKYGINIACIKRGQKLIFAPDKNVRLFALDHIGIIGTDEQLQVFKPVFDSTEPSDPSEHSIQDIVVYKMMVDDHNNFNGLSIRDSGIRELINGIVIGIERKDRRIVNPGSDKVLERGDIVWIAGERSKIQKLNKI